MISVLHIIVLALANWILDTIQEFKCLYLMMVAHRARVEKDE